MPPMLPMVLAPAGFFERVSCSAPLPGGRLPGQGKASLMAKPSSVEPLVFPGQIGRVILRPHRPHRSPHCFPIA